MGSAEVLYRVRQTAQAGLERRGWRRARTAPPAGAPGRAWVALLPRGFDAVVYTAAAERVLAGRFDVFALEDADLGFPPQWNRDPKTGTIAPLEFGKTLNYRDERVVGDIKYLWEPNRHAELVTLARAWYLSGDERYAEGCRTLLESWFDQCPYPLGPNWTSSLEHAVRLANWAVTWLLLGEQAIGEPGSPFRQRWLQGIYQHCHFIAGHFSRHSSANNHLLGELMGLFIGATVWPLWPESAAWRTRAAQEFEEQALLQNAPDGVNREQAIWYQHEVADMMLLAGLFGRANGHEFSPAFWTRLERMLEFIAALMDRDGNVPMIGDADDARLVPLARVDVYRSLLATGAVLFRRGDFKAKAGAFDDKSRWLLGDAAQQAFEALPVPPSEEPRRDFEAGGYAILGTGFGTEQEIRIVADAGPLGYLSIAAHGHADALAFTLTVGGYELLIDPGTYAYHTQHAWRDYFKGTSAHNTVRVDGLDQAVSGGSFLWTRHATAQRQQFTSNPTHDRWVASHDGYRRLRDPVLHQRTLHLDKATRVLQVTDRLECRGRHRVELFWHAHEECAVAGVAKGIVLRRASVSATLHMPNQRGSARIVAGQDEPPLGWVSRSFDVKAPCSTVVWDGEIEGTTELTTRIVIG